nr:hypothetical protein CFP56_19460 [Quercus suber]
MEAAPPSYEKATVVNHLDIVARYIPSSDLCSASLVCSDWHTTFAPQIWGNPASHFGVQNDHVYVALTRFKRTLQTARLLVRSLTHTLHLPPAQAELYDGPHADWLREILERLPNLQSLIVRGLPFFDHAALQALKYVKVQRPDYAVPGGVAELPASGMTLRRSPVLTRSGFSLRLLDCSRCTNVTAHGLAQALGRFETLLYLDLSFTYPAKQPEVLMILQRLHGLQVLKLRGIGLTDDALCTLAEAIGQSVRSLDIRSNLISDRGVRTLLDHCFVPEVRGSGESRTMFTGTWSPALLPYLSSAMLETYQGENFEGYLRNAFTDGFVSRMAIEDSRSRGITHLYIAENSLTAEGAGGLLRSGRLHVLDLGSLIRDSTSLAANCHIDPVNKGLLLPGPEKLIPVLAKHAADTLTFMRLEHAVVTKDIIPSNREDIIPGRVELADTSLPDLPRHAAELGGICVQHEAFELPTVQTPRAELIGDPMQFTVAPTAGSTPTASPSLEEHMATPRRGSVIAPEVVPIEAEHNSLLSPLSMLDEGTIHEKNLVVSPATVPSSAPEEPAMIAGVLNFGSFPFSESERRARIIKHTSGNHSLHPAMLPHLRSIVLTNIPPHSPDPALSDRLIGFIKQCAVESSAAKRQARLDYSVPPGRRGHATALKYSATRMFALERLVLEIANEGGSRQGSKTSPWQHVATRSMTEDRDSEALWSAAETDFSFFGDGEECGLPSDSGQSAVPQMSVEKQVVSDNSTLSGELSCPSAPRFDTIALLSKFRQGRKLAHERQLAAGAVDPETEGYWDGLVQVVRPAAGLRSDEDVDYYGNRFQAGWLYR